MSSLRISNASIYRLLSPYIIFRISRPISTVYAVDSSCSIHNLDINMVVLVSSLPCKERQKKPSEYQQRTHPHPPPRYAPVIQIVRREIIHVGSLLISK